MKTFDLTTIYNAGRPLSWSAIASFEWNPTQWHSKYVSKEKPLDTPELLFGSAVDKRIQSDKNFLPKLVRYSLMQHEMRAEFDGIPLLGIADTVNITTLKAKSRKGGNQYMQMKHALRDYKTGRKPWDQKRADETGQLTMYLALMYLEKKLRPEDFELYIDWLPTHIEEGKITFIKEGDIRTFKTKRTMHEVLTFLQRIKDTWANMEEYAARQARLTTSDINDW